MTSSSVAIPLYPGIDFPEDPGLPELPQLFDGNRVWEAYCREFGSTEIPPQQIRIRHFTHSPGRQAAISYLAEWPPEEYIPSEHFTIRTARGQPVELFRYPDDKYLPGLSEAADPEAAIKLINKYVLAVPARRAIRVEVVRYRPGNRAVLRHRLGKAGFYVRVIRPDAVAPLLEAAEIVGKSDFVAPRLAGLWPEGGVMWLSEIPGENARKHLRKGNQPAPSLFLDRLESLWAVSSQANGGSPFSLQGAYRRAKQSFSYALRDDEDIRRIFDYATLSLDSFVDSWRPSCIAHNDFYDDQMLILPDGKVALVDFEEGGPGEPMLDVGNFLAHLRWNARFGRRENEAGASQAYYDIFRRAALERFAWNEQELSLREAICLFRICTNSIRHIQGDWRHRLKTGLCLVNETVG